MPNPMSEIVRIAKNFRCETFQVFIRNNRNLRQRHISREEISEFNGALLSAGFRKWVIHAPYVMNPSSPEYGKRDKAVRAITEDLDLLQQFAGEKYYVLHPGSHMGEGIPFGEDMLLSTLQRVNNTTNTKICLEFMSGSGSLMLSSPMQILSFNKKATDLQLGYTFDTCHCFAAGFVPATAYKYIKDIVSVVHVNGSAGLFGSRLDNHTNLHDGAMPFEVNAKFYKQVPTEVPIILETPANGSFQDLLDLINY